MSNGFAKEITSGLMKKIGIYKLTGNNILIRADASVVQAPRVDQVLEGSG